MSDDLAALCIEGDVQFSPGSRCSAMLLLLPLAAAEQLQAAAVDDKMQGAVGHDPRSLAGEATTAAGQGGVIRDGEIKPEKTEDAADEPLRLPKGKMKDEPQHEH